MTGSKWVCRPVIPVQVIYRSETLAGFQYSALIDSGADWCLFHAEIGRVLKIPIESGELESFVGVEGSAQIAYLHQIELVVGDHAVAIKVGFVNGFRFPYGLLGQAGFFDQFEVTLRNLLPTPYVEVNPLS